MPHRLWVNQWVKHRITGRVGMVRGISKDPDGPAVLVRFRGSETLFYWPVALVERTEGPKRKSRKNGTKK